MVLLYTSIWLALVCLLFAELGRGRQRHNAFRAPWASPLSAAGLALAGAHSVLAVGVVYGWDHALAARVTAARAAEVYGTAWAGSLYVNYAFLAWWGIDLVWWQTRPRAFFARPVVIDWAWRLVAFTMIINGAVIFASPAGRLAGVPLTAAFLFVWWQDRRG